VPVRVAAPQVPQVTASPPMPRNGRHFVAVLVGGDQVPFELGGEVFEEYGIAIEYRWFKDRHIGTPPRDVDCILIMTDLSSAQMIREASKIAKSAHIPYALVGRKKAAWMNGLKISGFVQRPSWLKPSGPKKEILMQPSPAQPVTPARNGAPLRAPDAFERVEVKQPEAPKPAPASAAPTIAPIDTTARYVANARAWTESEGSMALQLAESWKPTDGADGFLMRVWKSTGNYRTARALLFQLRGLRYLIGAQVIALCDALRHAAEAQAKERKTYLAEEAKEIAAGRWPAWISRKRATAMAARTFPNAMLDRILGLHVVAESEFRPLLEARRAVGFKDGERIPTGVPGPEAVKTDILTRLAQHPRLANEVTRAIFGSYVLQNLIKDGSVVARTEHGKDWIMLPGHTVPQPRQAVQAGSVGAMQPQVVNIVNAAPVADGDTARREVFRALREGQISAKDAAAILRELGGKE